MNTSASPPILVRSFLIKLKAENRRGSDGFPASRASKTEYTSYKIVKYNQLHTENNLKYWQEELNVVKMADEVLELYCTIHDNNNNNIT